MSSAFKICASRLKSTDIKTKIHGKIKRFADTDLSTFPNVSGVTVLLYSGAVAKTLNGPSGGVDGQILHVIVGNDPTAIITIDHSIFSHILPGGADVFLQAGTQITGISLIYSLARGVWFSRVYDT